MSAGDFFWAVTLIVGAIFSASDKHGPALFFFACSLFACVAQLAGWVA